MSKPRLLLADDSVTIRKVVELTFADEGVDVTTAADGDSAMQSFVQAQPDIVLADVSLPGTSGYKLCEIIKGDNATNHIPVLLLVGSFEPFDQDEAERAGADGFLTKPFQSIRDLVARVNGLLNVEQHEQSEIGLSEGDVQPAEDARDDGSTGETEDIENLYQSSFADTVPIDQADTAADLFGDTGLDDEMIEASYPSADANRPTESDLLNSKDFDWTPSSFGSEGFDPPEGSGEINRTPEIEESDNIPDVGEERSDEANAVGDVPSEHHGELETSSEPIDPFAEEAKEEPVGQNQALASIEPSPEFVSLVAQRVVEKLSDHAIREIAREAVPRIAEKLIREALAEENKG